MKTKQAASNTNAAETDAALELLGHIFGWTRKAEGEITTGKIGSPHLNGWTALKTIKPFLFFQRIAIVVAIVAVILTLLISWYTLGLDNPVPNSIGGIPIALAVISFLIVVYAIIHHEVSSEMYDHGKKFEHFLSILPKGFVNSLVTELFHVQFAGDMKVLIEGPPDEKIAQIKGWEADLYVHTVYELLWDELEAAAIQKIIAERTKYQYLIRRAEKELVKLIQAAQCIGAWRKTRGEKITMRGMLLSWAKRNWLESEGPAEQSVIRFKYVPIAEGILSTQE